MKEVRDVSDIIDILKDDLSNDIDGLVFDYHLAEALGTSNTYIPTSRCRNTINYQMIIEYCIERGLDLNYVLARGQ